MSGKRTAYAARLIRHRRIRQRLGGTSAKPRLNVFRSSRYTYAQVIDDSLGHTLVSASSLELNKSELPKTEAAREVGLLIAHRAKAKGVAAVVFDRGGYNYHGRVKALADAAREGGLKF